MFCPQCSQEQISEDTRFCSRCGFLMTGVPQLLANNGMLPQLLNSSNSGLETPRKKGVRKGGKLMLLGLIIVPLILFFSLATRSGPFLTILFSILFFWGGLLRIIYAAIFESNQTLENKSGENLIDNAKKLFDRKKKPDALPLHETFSDSEYIPEIVSNVVEMNS